VTSKPDFKVVVLLLVFMQLTRDLFAIAKFLYIISSLWRCWCGLGKSQRYCFLALVAICKSRDVLIAWILCEFAVLSYKTGNGGSFPSTDSASTWIDCVRQICHVLG